MVFAPADGEGAAGHRFWLVADVAWLPDVGGGGRCAVRPIFADAGARTPFFTTDLAADLAFGPPYPPAP